MTYHRRRPATLAWSSHSHEWKDVASVEACTTRLHAAATSAGGCFCLTGTAVQLEDRPPVSQFICPPMLLLCTMANRWRLQPVKFDYLTAAAAAATHATPTQLLSCIGPRSTVTRIKDKPSARDAQPGPMQVRPSSSLSLPDCQVNGAGLVAMRERSVPRSLTLRAYAPLVHHYSPNCQTCLLHTHRHRRATHDHG